MIPWQICSLEGADYWELRRIFPLAKPIPTILLSSASLRGRKEDGSQEGLAPYFEAHGGGLKHCGC